MTDVSTIGGVLTGVKAAIEIANHLRTANVSLEKAETKMKLADLISALSDVKIESANLQDTLLEKDRKIRELEDKLSEKRSLQFENAVYWLKNGTETDGPFCPQCYDSNSKVIRLQTTEDDHWYCKTCSNSFRGRAYSARIRTAIAAAHHRNSHDNSWME